MTETNLQVKTLEEKVTYTFIVQAETIDFGPAISGNVTTGPQEGSPMPPTDLKIKRQKYSVDLEWTNGATGKAPLLGYYIETRTKGMYQIARFYFIFKYILFSFEL